MHGSIEPLFGHRYFNAFIMKFYLWILAFVSSNSYMNGSLRTALSRSLLQFKIAMYMSLTRMPQGVYFCLKNTLTAKESSFETRHSYHFSPLRIQNSPKAWILSSLKVVAWPSSEWCIGVLMPLSSCSFAIFIVIVPLQFHLHLLICSSSNRYIYQELVHKHKLSASF